MAVTAGIRLTACALTLVAVTSAKSLLAADGGSATSTPAAKQVSTEKVAAPVAAAKPAKPVKQMRSSKRAELNPRGQILSLSCASCHGTDGKSAGIMPPLFGRSSEYIETALKEFKSGDRYSTVMARHAKGYTDQEIKLIADYFGSISSCNTK